MRLLLRRLRFLLQQQLPLLRVALSLLVRTGAALIWCHVGFRDVTHTSFGVWVSGSTKPGSPHRLAHASVVLLGLGQLLPRCLCVVCVGRSIMLSVSSVPRPIRSCVCVFLWGFASL